MDKATSEQTVEALHYLQSKVPPNLHQPVIGVICGSGLDGLADAVLPNPRFEIPYMNIPHFPSSTGMDYAKRLWACLTCWIGLVQGHAGKLLFGVFEPEGLPVVLMIGRVQFVITYSQPLLYRFTTVWCFSSFYEGHSIQSITFPIRLMKRLGVSTIIGRAARQYACVNIDDSKSPMPLVAWMKTMQWEISWSWATWGSSIFHVSSNPCKHINIAGLAGIHPLRGPNSDDFGVRFPALSDAYDLDLRRRTHSLWKGFEREPGSTRHLHEGIYAFVGGPR